MNRSINSLRRGLVVVLLRLHSFRDAAMPTGILPRVQFNLIQAALSEADR